MTNTRRIYQLKQILWVARADRRGHHLIYIVQLAGMRWLVEGAQSGDSLFFYCKRYTGHMLILPDVDINLVSGHATQVPDQDGDEQEDGLDECR